MIEFQQFQMTEAQMKEGLGWGAVHCFLQATLCPIPTCFQHVCTALAGRGTNGWNTTVYGQWM